MNNFLKILLTMIFFYSFSFATAGGPDNLDVRGVASNDVRWMHPSPSYKSKKIGKIPYNARCLKNLGCKGRWCKVNYRGAVGWVNGKFLGESGHCPQSSYSDYSQEKSSHPRFTKQIIEGKTLQTKMYGSDLTVKFIPSQFKSFDGDMVFHFSSNDPEQDEILSYRLIDGKIVYYGNDGSKHRMTLHSITPTSWIILEEEDMDGDDKQFGFGKSVKSIYKIQRSSNVSPSSTSNYREYDQLYMQIYGRLDTRIASNREYWKEVDKFLYTAAPYLMDKYKFDLKLHNLKLDKNANISTKSINSKKKFQRQFKNIEKLDGKTVEDHDGNRYSTFNALEKAFKIAGQKSIELQRVNYQDERKREKLMVEMKKLLDRTGTTEQKKYISKLESAGQDYDYKYYKKFLDDTNILLLSDRQVSQKKPIFHNRLFILALLMKKQSLTYLNSDSMFQINSIRDRIQNIELQSKKLKHQFNQDYLYEICSKPPMYPN